MGDDDETMQVTFRIDRDTIDHLDDLIWENKVEGNLDRDVKRSHLLREQVDELIEELEGNSRTATQTVTAD